MEYIVKDDGHAYRRYDAGNGCTIEENIGLATNIELSCTETTLSAVVKDYLGNVDTSFNDTIIFDVDGTQVKAYAAMGQAAITLAPGQHVVKTMNEGIGNSEITVEVN